MTCSSSNNNNVVPVRTSFSRVHAYARYHFTMHGVRTGQWKIFQSWFYVEVLMCQVVPMACFVILLAVDPVTCGRNFCARSFYVGFADGVAPLFSLAAAWDFFASFLLRLVVFSSTFMGAK